MDKATIQRFLKKLIQISIVRRTLISLAVLSLLLIAINAISNRTPKEVTKRSASSVNLTLHENLIILDEFRLFNAKNGNAMVSISQLNTSLESNLKAYDDLKNSSEALNNDEGLRNDIDKAISNQKSKFTQFNETYGFYGKIINYIPSDDLGTLDPSVKQDELQSRLAAAINSLSTIRSGQPLKKAAGQRSDYSNLLTSNTKLSLDNSISCFNQADSILKSLPVTGFKEKIKECSTIYESVRTNALLDCLDKLAAEDLAEQISPLVKRLDQISNNP